MTIGEEFRVAFLSEYEAARCALDETVWERIWTDGLRWAALVLWQAPELGGKSILGKVAERLGLEYWGQGEPFRVDAAMYSRGSDVFGSIPFPLKVAIEHEFNVRTIKEEFARLIHLRVPLKVIITYAVADSSGLGRQIVHARNLVLESLATLTKKFTTGMSDTEYLVLIGEEIQPKVLKWHVLNVEPSKTEPGSWVFMNV